MDLVRLRHQHRFLVLRRHGRRAGYGFRSAIQPDLAAADDGPLGDGGLHRLSLRRQYRSGFAALPGDQGLAPDKQGKNPIGIAITAGKKQALVANDVSRNASLVDFNTQRVAVTGDAAIVVQTSALPAAGSDADKVLRGKRFLEASAVEGLGFQDLKEQGFASGPQIDAVFFAGEADVGGGDAE